MTKSFEQWFRSWRIGLVVKRCNLGWSQERAAHFIGVNKTTYGRAESGERLPSRENVKKIDAWLQGRY